MGFVFSTLVAVVLQVEIGLGHLLGPDFENLDPNFSTHYHSTLPGEGNKKKASLDNND